MQDVVLSELALQIMLVTEQLRRSTKAALFARLCEQFAEYTFERSVVYHTIEALNTSKMLICCLQVNGEGHFIISDSGMQKLFASQLYQAHRRAHPQLSHAA